jgi:chemotaxis response regulator CheB
MKTKGPVHLGPRRNSDGPTASRRRVIVADGVLLREAIGSLLEPSGFDVARPPGDGSRLRTLVREHASDLIIIGIRMPPTHTTEGLGRPRLR